MAGLYRFNGILFDDVVINMDDSSNWSQICKRCIKKHNVPAQVLDDQGSGICGVKGCGNSSTTVYIDFPKNQLKQVKLSERRWIAHGGYQRKTR